MAEKEHREDSNLQEAVSSDYSYNSDDNWSDDCDNYYDSDLDNNATQNLDTQPQLEEDVENLISIYGDDCMTYRSFDSIDDLDIELKLPLDDFDPEIARAWKMIQSEPIILRLHLSRTYYLNSAVPKVEVFQPSQKDLKQKFGVGQQLTKIIEVFISEQWKKISNESVKSQFQLAPQSKGAAPPRKKRFLSQLSSSSGDNSKSKGKSDTESDSAVVSDRALAEIINMGFNADEGRNALVMCRGQVQEAVNLLVAEPNSCNTLPKSPSASPKKPCKGKDSKKEKSPSQALAASSQLHGVTKTFNSLIDSLFGSSSKHLQSHKDIPALKYGFLVQVMQYARQRLPTLNEYCVICDKRHIFQNGAMLKPAVCSGDLCVFSFQTLGVMSDAAEDVATGAEVVDLLVSMAIVACKSARRDLIFDPYPTVIDPRKPTELAFCPKDKKFSAVEKCLDSFLSTKEMVKLDATGLKKAMDKKDYLAYPLLQWIINSNRSHIVKLPVSKQLSFMHTEHQFLMMSSPPAKEAAFREAKAKHGSIFAFHGSHIENWHSIVRVGLINASGTKFQVNGAAHGKGIYLSSKASRSSGYSTGCLLRPVPPPSNSSGDGKVSDRFLKSRNLICMALCEAVNSPELKKNADIIVCPNPDHVCTRFFFVYEKAITGDTSIDTQNVKYNDEIRKAVTFSYR